MHDEQKQFLRKLAIWAIIALVIFAVFYLSAKEYDGSSADRAHELIGANVGFWGWITQHARPLSVVLLFVLVVVVVAFIAVSWRRQGGLAISSFGEGAAINVETVVPTRFKDVIGCDEAKSEVEEIVDFLKNPERYTRLGAEIPRGALLSGEPGVGKTLLARAIAGEAGVPFFSISGSDFVEMFVGVGAARVRSLFENARKKSPSIVFIDEIDAVGRARGTLEPGGAREHEQTLNQLLVEMDGFKKDDTVIVIAATNRPDKLDAALMRPGRFDRKIFVPTPDVRGREELFLFYLAKIGIERSVAGEIAARLARATPGLSGAHIRNLVNEAAISAGRRNSPVVEVVDFEHSRERILYGKKKRLVMTDIERRAIAYHEAGHTAVSLGLRPLSNPIDKVTIVSNGNALGATIESPETDRYTQSAKELQARIAILFGGRLAEMTFLGDATTGAANDLERATIIAREMATRYGMNSDEELGRLVLTGTTESPFSQQTLEAADRAAKNILDVCYRAARRIIMEREKFIRVLAEALLEKETIARDEIERYWANCPRKITDQNSVDPFAE